MRNEVVGNCLLREGDCLEDMGYLEPESVDMILADLPYGTTACKWDSVIPFEPLWAHYKRIIKPRGAIVLTASQPFTSALVMSNVAMFRHEWVWIKNAGSNFANTVREPMKEHESVLVFSRGKWTYNKQMQQRTAGGAARVGSLINRKSASENYREMREEIKELPELRVPSSWQKFNRERGLHPTQKPVALMEYLIRTYTNEGETVLDNTMGSGTTGVACVNTKRQFVGIEQDTKYFDIAVGRIRGVQVKEPPPRYFIDRLVPSHYLKFAEGKARWCDQRGVFAESGMTVAEAAKRWDLMEVPDAPF